VVYSLAWELNDPHFLPVDTKVVRETDDEGEARSYKRSWLILDVFASSAAALELLAQQVPPASPEGSGSEEWMPAGQAVVLAQRAGFIVNLSWVTRSAEKHGVKKRDRQLPGKHKVEVEWKSLVVALVRMRAKDSDLDEPARAERDEIEKQMRESGEKKQRARPLN
jgi:hypothetical protein